MIKFQEDHTTPEQSKRLLELGIPAESADCYYSGTIKHIVVIDAEIDKKEFFRGDIVPCWSVGRLIEIWLHCNKFSIDSTSEPITIGLIDFCYNFIDDFIHLIKKAVSSKHIDFSKLEIQ